MAKKHIDESSAPTLTKASLAECIFDNVGLPKKHAMACVESIFDEIKRQLTENENAKISGFGVFETREKSGRVGRNPKTLAEVEIKPRRVVTFRISNNFKSDLNL